MSTIVYFKFHGTSTFVPVWFTTRDAAERWIARNKQIWFIAVLLIKQDKKDSFHGAARSARLAL